MNLHQLKQYLFNNLWHGENGRRPHVSAEIIASAIMPNTSRVWGLDISHWNIPPVDLKRMKDIYGMSFVIIKGADGSLKTKYFPDHVMAAKAAGLPFGMYVWLYPNNRVSIDAQVGAWVALWNEYKPPLGVFIDAETTYYGGTVANPQASDLTAAHEKLKALTGQLQTTYTSYGYSKSNLIGFDWNKYPRLWVANYTTASAPLLPSGASVYEFWQYTDNLDGAQLDPNGNKSLDGNYYNGTAEQFAAKYLGGTVPPTNGGNVKYELKPAGSYNVSIRAENPDAHILGSAVGSILNGTTAQADDKYIYTADKYVSGVLRAKAGDTWYHVTSPAVGWSAELHLGVRYLNVTEIPTVTRKVTVTVEEDGWKPVSVEVTQEQA